MTAQSEFEDNLVAPILLRSYNDINDAIEEFDNTCKEDGYKQAKATVHIQGMAMALVERLFYALGAVRTREFLSAALLDAVEFAIKKNEILENEDE